MRSTLGALRGRGRRLLIRVRSRREDVVVASFPKSGRNWLLFLIANALLAENGEERTVTFRNVHDLVPEDDPRSATLPGVGGITATHREFDGRRGRVVYVIRDPRDVLVSYHDYLKGRWSHEVPPLDTFVESERWGVPAWCRHVTSWAPARSRLVRYEELHEDTGGELRRLLDDLGLPVDDAAVERAVERSSFQSMKRIEHEHGLPPREGADPSYRFMRKGAVGEGRRALDRTGLDRMHE
ncbi:MAG: sulfotransferase domain-containing protein, partial [Gemmatimonadota bacterium]